MNAHSFAVTAVGIAHGTRTLARSRARPLKARFITIAIHIPRTTSRTTVQMVKKTVVNIESQNWEPRVRGGQAPVPPGLLHRCRRQCVRLMTPAVAPLGKLPFDEADEG